MSNPLAHYAFLPWLRRGIGSMIPEKDALGSAPSGGMAKERANIQVGITVETTSKADGSVSPDAVSKQFQYMGPPDILGISDRAIIRTEPKLGVQNYEANGLPYIEFFEEDFLWAYTPAGVDTGSDKWKLTPWLALICLKDDEFTMTKDSEGRAVVRIDNQVMDSVFHPETQHWAWGHVHLNTDLVASGLSGQINEVGQEIAADPDSGLSRLLCPRKLQGEVNYTACLIPAFETGRLAGLGLDYSGVFAQEMSWAIGRNYGNRERGFEYPVYYSWNFRTDSAGDFETLARKLEALVAPPELGKRDMYIDAPGMGLDGMSDSVTLGVEGALKPPSYSPDAWPNGPGDTAYRNQMRQLLNLSLDNENQVVSTDTLLNHPFAWASLSDDPVVTPHVYGRWHAMVSRLTNSGNPAWVNQLNLHPGNRAAAGLGVDIVQDNQEKYMQEAWEQVEAINEANEKIRKAAVAAMVNHALYQKHLLRARKDKKIRMTNAVHKFVVEGSSTIHKAIHDSLIPDASQKAGFRKITRPGTKVNRKFNKLAGNAQAFLHQTVTENFNNDQIRTAPLKLPVSTAIQTSTVDSTITSALSQYTTNDTAMATQAVFLLVLAETADAGLFNQMQTPARRTVLKNAINADGSLSSAAKTSARNLIDGIIEATHGGANSNHLVKIDIPTYDAHFGQDDTAKIYQGIVLFRDTNGAPGVGSTITTTLDIQAFQTAFTDFNAFATANAVGAFQRPALASSSVTNIEERITNKLKQKGQMVKRVERGVLVKIFNAATGQYQTNPLTKLRPIMAHPEYDEPMFRKLKDISKDYILPNLNLVPNNSITLLETNQRFIEAFMAGLNHELGRELLWREFPTDQRGSYFRRFWDVSDDIYQTDPEKQLDIEKMHTWNQDLGDHSPRVVGNSSGGFLVLLIRGDLLRKYPNTQVYAQKAAFKDELAPDTPRDLASANDPNNIKVPVFMAELDPDVYLFAFDLETSEAKGDSSDASKPGWYFVLRERPGQIRFGLDDWSEPQWPASSPTNWNDLSWEHFVNNAAALNDYQLDATKNLGASAGTDNTPAATWGKNAADVASILYQNPVLYARHAQEMLPD